jgi:hypothetical protein
MNEPSSVDGTKRSELRDEACYNGSNETVRPETPMRQRQEQAMSDTPETPDESPRQRRLKEFEDHHFHDDDEVAPVDDIQSRGTNRKPMGRKPPRRLPPRRPHYED